MSWAPRPPGGSTVAVVPLPFGDLKRRVKKPSDKDRTVDLGHNLEADRSEDSTGKEVQIFFIFGFYSIPCYPETLIFNLSFSKERLFNNKFKSSFLQFI